MTQKSKERIARDREAIQKFHALYEKCLALAPSCLHAYLLAERIHKHGGNKPFYKNYMSFANSRKHFLKKIKHASRN